MRQVRDEMQAKTKAGMPDRISDEVYVDLVKEAVGPWELPTKVFVQQAMKDLQAELDAALDQAMENLKKRCVYKEARKHVKECLGVHLKSTQEALMRLYRDEKERLLTFNEEAFKRYKDEEHICLTRFRHNMRMEAAGFPTRPLGQWGELTEEKRAQDAKRRDAELLKLGPDQFGREIEVIAYVRGYYRLAALRFADSVSQRILCRTIPVIRRELPVHLEKRLGLREADAIGTYERLMAEDRRTAEQREALKSERHKFVKALQSIEKLEAAARRAAEPDSQSTQPMASAGINAEIDMGEA